MRVPRLQTVLQWLVVAAVLCFALQVFSDNKADVDLWGNVGFVKGLPGSDGFLSTNTYSYTEPGRDWVNHEWLAEYLLYRVWRLAGNPGLLLLKVALGLSVLALLYATLRQECRSGPVRILLLLLIISTMSYGFSTRPHLFTYLFLALFLFLLKRYRWRPWLHGIVLPLLGIVWVNLHGAFFISILVLVVNAIAATVGYRRRELPRSGLLMVYAGIVLFVGVTFINPYGARLWGFIFESGSTVRPYLSEWAPFSPIRDGLTHVDFICLAVIVCCAYSFTKTHKDVAWTILVYLALIAAIVLRRNIPLFAIVTGFMVGPHIDSLAGKSVDRLMERVPRWVWVCVPLLFIPYSLYTALTFNKTRPLAIEIARQDYPLRTVAFMQQQGLSGNLFVFFDWAEYCIWHLYPACHVFMDGRFRSAYGQAVVDDYLAGLYGREDWDRVLTAYPTDMALVHYGNPIARLLAQRPDWQMIYSDGPAVLYVKRSMHEDIVNAVRRGGIPPVESPPAIFP